jgi:hypothetical protein
MLVLATDYSGVVWIFWAAAGAVALINALVFLLYYSVARPRGLPRPFPSTLVLAAIAFTVIYPVGGFAVVQLIDGLGPPVHRVVRDLVVTGLPALAGSLLLLPFLRRDIRGGHAWLAPLMGMVPVLPLLLTAFDPGLFGILTWPIPWHLTCAVVFFTLGRGSWNAELLQRAACPSCGYSRTGLSASICPECGKAFPA